jgi:hypothetical protein
VSIKNIYRIDPISNGGCVIHFRTDSGLRSYKYGKVAAKKIREDSRDPSEFVAHEIHVKEK